MSLAPDWHVFDNREALAAALATRVVSELSSAVSRRGTALLAVSGGTTPARFFGALSQQAAPWDQVSVTLVDERMVDESSPRSNARLVRETLLREAAATARFVPLYGGSESLEAAAAAAEQRLAELAWPIDVAILGMGADGHTASFFPDALGIVTLLDPASPLSVLPVEAASAGEHRLTLSLRRLIEARDLVLHIEGAEKRDVIEAALGDVAPRMPIRSVIDHARRAVQIFWAP